MQTGDTLFDLEIPGSSLDRIAQFSHATEDPNPIHVDPDFAKACGFPQVIQQGPMTTAHFARLLAEHVGAQKLAWIDVSFVAPVFPLEALRMQARVSDVSGHLVQIEITATKADGTVTARGQAQVDDAR
jgi:acyl dehydratase